jgi:hypothetical protein
MDVFRPALECAFEHALGHLAGVDNRPVQATVGRVSFASGSISRYLKPVVMPSE